MHYGILALTPMFILTSTAPSRVAVLPYSVLAESSPSYAKTSRLRWLAVQLLSLLVLGTLPIPTTPTAHIGSSIERRLANITTFIKARRKDSSDIRDEIIGALKQYQSKKTLIIIDTLHPLCAVPPPFSLATYLSSLLALSPTLSLIAIYHLDIPLPLPLPSNSTPSPQTPKSDPNPYAPTSLTLLTYLSTTLLTVHSLAQTHAKHTAHNRSLAEPVFGIEEERDGILTALCPMPRGSNDGGYVLEMEHRRRSGRGGGVVRFWMPCPLSSSLDMNEIGKPMLLDAHPLFAKKEFGGAGAEMGKGTFELGLTEKQRRDREGVVLPYFDAQKGSVGEGGRILYDLGAEDDFDEEDDEI